MAKDKKSFIAYCDWQDTFEALPDDKAGQLIKHIFKYVNDENPVCDDILINAVFANIKQSLKRDLKKYDDRLKQKKEGGIIGNLKRWHPDLYEKYVNKELSLSDCTEIASNRTISDTDQIPIVPDRKTSDTDRIPIDTERTQSDTVAKIADSVNDNVSGSVSVNENKKKVSKDTVAKAPIFFFKKELVNLNVESQVADDWIKVRKTKRAANTKTAFDALVKEFEKSGLSPNDCIKISVENSWSGFKAVWLENKQNIKGFSPGQKHYQKNNRTCNDW